MSGSAPALAAAPTDCQHCGSFVSRNWRRVYGDDRSRAHRCPSCDSRRRLQAGSAAGKDVPVPDPEDYPDRQRNGGGRP